MTDCNHGCSVLTSDCPVYQLAARRERGECAWEEDENGIWQTSCGEMFEFTNGGPTENRAKYCQYCGMPIKASRA